MKKFNKITAVIAGLGFTVLVLCSGCKKSDDVAALNAKNSSTPGSTSTSAQGGGHGCNHTNSTGPGGQ